MSAVRTIAVWCPDWPVTAATADAGGGGGGGGGGGIDGAERPAAVFTANRVVACSQAARVEGVRRGQRRREAQARCPELVVLARDVLAEARAFEPIVTGLESIAPGVEITRPGLALIGARGPTRYFGGETGVLSALSGELARTASRVASDLLIGIADGAFAAEQAARQGVIVPAGESPAFLAGLPVSALDLPEQEPLVGLLGRLGLRTLGAFAALPARDVLARFGATGAWAHRQAGGRDERPVAGRRPPAELTAAVELDEPVERVDTMAFTASSTAERFITQLAEHGLACTCLELSVRTDRGEQHSRRWRLAGVLNVVDVLDRLRWQLEGWRAGPQPPRGGIVGLRLVPIDTVPTGAHQQALWGGSGVTDERAHRGLARVQTRLGPGAVHVPVPQGGRTPAQRTGRAAWGDDLQPRRPRDRPWPGQLPAPAPSVVLDPPRPVQVLDERGQPVRVTDTGAVPWAPAGFVADPHRPRPVPITAWAGPWPVDAAGWDVSARLRMLLFQLVDVSGRAYLVHCQFPDSPTDPPRWALDAVYD